MDPKQLFSKYTPSQIAAGLHLERLRRDFAYCAETLFKVAPKNPGEGGGLIPFRLNRAQIEMNRVAEAQLARDGWVRLCLLKHRQPGGSTWASGWGYRMAALTPHTHGMIFAQDDDTSTHIMDMVKRFHDNMPPNYQPRTYARPAGGLELCDPASPNKHNQRRQGSTLHGQTARTALSGTGHTLQFVQLSEAAKYPYARDLWTNMSQAIPNAANTVVIIESTAFPTGAWFRERCEQAQKDQSSPYQFLFIPWYLSDDYSMPLAPGEHLVLTLEERQRVDRFGLTPEQIKWYRFKLVDMGDDDMAHELMKQEYPEVAEDAWIDMTASVFDRRRLYGYLQQQKRPPMRLCDILPNSQLQDNPAGVFSIWEMPLPGEQYDIGVDVASGEEDDDQDWAVCSVTHRRTRKQVAEWRARIDPIALAQVAYDIGFLYNIAQIGVEVTGLGVSTNKQLHTLGYPNLYIQRRRGEAEEKLTRKTGWTTNNTSKNFLVTTLRHYIVNERVEIRSPVLWQEMTTFTKYVTDKGLIGYSAPPGYHDDTVMAFMISIVIGDDERPGLDFDVPEPQGVDREAALRNYVQRNMRDNFDFASLEQDDDPLADLASMLEGGL